IVRTWPLRGTLHFVAAQDVHWMLDLLAARTIRRNAARQLREHGMDERVMRRARTGVRRALSGGGAMTRDELYAVIGSEQGLHLVWRLEHEKLICFGARRGKQQTFVLLDEWIPPSRGITPADPLEELARRYFRSHGPATAEDFAWWAGIPLSEARRVTPGRIEERVRASASVHLLPPFDEYTVAYADRSAILDPRYARRVNAGGGIINAVIVLRGQVVGTWKRTLSRAEVNVAPTLFRELTRAERSSLERELARYAAFVGRTRAAAHPERDRAEGPGGGADEE
ncbi:MAG TPA: winged helix DNA-binding domain-containing protein, partial [Thermoanaerobaculia bacterium]|nr:winged helix DNA-binding domain-containing protein [Thermoanaerobaculia bacterium]